ncbi:MAG: hypothetical protein ABSE07_05795 [Methanoregula sp.]|jgi:hypothetical protein
MTSTGPNITDDDINHYADELIQTLGLDEVATRKIREWDDRRDVTDFLEKNREKYKQTVKEIGNTIRQNGGTQCVDRVLNRMKEKGYAGKASSCMGLWDWYSEYTPPSTEKNSFNNFSHAQVLERQLQDMTRGAEKSSQQEVVRRKDIPLHKKIINVFTAGQEKRVKYNDLINKAKTFSENKDITKAIKYIESALVLYPDDTVASDLLKKYRKMRSQPANLDYELKQGLISQKQYDRIKRIEEAKSGKKPQSLDKE